MISTRRTKEAQAAVFLWRARVSDKIATLLITRHAEVLNDRYTLRPIAVTCGPRTKWTRYFIKAWRSCEEPYDKTRLSARDSVSAILIFSTCCAAVPGLIPGRASRVNNYQLIIHRPSDRAKYGDGFIDCSPSNFTFGNNTLKSSALSYPYRPTTREREQIGENRKGIRVCPRERKKSSRYTSGGYPY